MSLVNSSFVIQEGETELECVFVERKSPYMKGKWLEEKVVEYLMSKSVFCEGKGGSGDGGIDIRGHMYGVPFAAQCKNYRRKIGPATVRELIGALALISSWILGIIVIPSKKIYLKNKWTNGYTPGAYDTANRLGIVLTDLDNVYLDIRRAVINRLKFYFFCSAFIIIIFCIYFNL